MKINRQTPNRRKEGYCRDFSLDKECSDNADSNSNITVGATTIVLLAVIVMSVFWVNCSDKE